MVICWALGGCQARGVVRRRWLHASGKERVKVQRVVWCGGNYCVRRLSATRVGFLWLFVWSRNSINRLGGPVAVRFGRRFNSGFCAVAITTSVDCATRLVGTSFDAKVCWQTLIGVSVAILNAVLVVPLFPEKNYLLRTLLCSNALQSSTEPLSVATIDASGNALESRLYQSHCPPAGHFNSHRLAIQVL